MTARTCQGGSSKLLGNGGFSFFLPHTFCQCGTSMESPSGGDQRWLTDSGSALV